MREKIEIISNKTKNSKYINKKNKRIENHFRKISFTI